MKLYHYSKEHYPELLTRRATGQLTADDIRKAEETMVRFSEVGAYIDHISFFIDPIPSSIMGKIYGKDHGFWFPGNQIFEHVVETEELEQGVIFDLVESPRRDEFMDQFEKDHNWTMDDPELLKLYFKELSAKKREWGEIGSGVKNLNKQIKLYQGKIDQFIHEASKHPDFKHFKHKYAANVPHFMIYPGTGRVGVKRTNALTIGEAGRKSV